jgi:hypothetical protein
MPWRSVLLLVPLFCCVPLACNSLSVQNVIDAPPTNPREADRWWKERIDRMPLSFLAVYVEAADRHQLQGTSATYRNLFEGRTNGGLYRRTSLFPCPPPRAALLLMRDRRKDYRPETEPSETVPQRFVIAQDCHGCTEQRALEIWEEARAKVFPSVLKRSEVVAP